MKKTPKWSEREMKALLTPDERQVLLRIAAGHTNEAIGRELHFSLSRIKSILESIYRKLRVTGREHAVAVAIRFGVIDLKELS